MITSNDDILLRLQMYPSFAINTIDGTDNLPTYNWHEQHWTDGATDREQKEEAMRLLVLSIEQQLETLELGLPDIQPARFGKPGRRRDAEVQDHWERFYTLLKLRLYAYVVQRVKHKEAMKKWIKKHNELEKTAG